MRTDKTMRHKTSKIHRVLYLPNCGTSVNHSKYHLYSFTESMQLNKQCCNTHTNSHTSQVPWARIFLACNNPRPRKSGSVNKIAARRGSYSLAKHKIRLQNVDTTSCLWNAESETKQKRWHLKDKSLFFRRW